MTGRIWRIGTLASVAILGVVLGPARGQLQAKPAAVVNGDRISLPEVDGQVQWLLKVRPPANPLTDAQKKSMKFDVLTGMIDDLLMKHFLRTNGPKIEASEVNKELAQLEAGLKAQKKTLQDFYRENGETESQLREELVSRCQWNRICQARVNDTQLRRYYDENKEFFDGVRVRASHIVLRVSANSTEAQRQALRSQLVALRQDILSGKIDFAEAAKKHSQCPSAPKGGDIDYIMRKGLHEGFTKAAFALKVGEISDVIQSDYGLHLIKVTDRDAGKPTNYDQIKDDVRKHYEWEMMMSILAQERARAKVEINLP